MTVGSCAQGVSIAAAIKVTASAMSASETRVDRVPMRWTVA